MISRTRVTSAALRTKDSAIRSKLLRRAKRRSSSSFSESAGTLTATPGRLMPLLLLTGPGTTTLVTTSVSLTLTASSCTLPSSIRIMSPGRTSAGRPLKVVLQRCTSPRMLSMVMVKVWPSTNSTGPAANRPSRILGPWRSASRPTVLPMAFAAARVSARRRACSSWEPWLMLKRATSRPGCDRRSTPAWSAERGRRPDPGPARRDRPVGRRDCAAPADERGQGRAGLPQPTPGSSWPAAATSRLVSPRRWTRSARGWASPESPHAERPAGGDPAARPTDSVRVASARG